MIEPFGTLPDGRTVHRITLQGGGLTAEFLTYGAVLQDLRLDGHEAPLVLGFGEFAPYLTHSPYFGATVGRCANRIRGGLLDLGGKEYQLDQNFVGKHSLHGGSDSLGKRLWNVESYNTNRVVLETTLDDGHMGYPGRLDVQVTFALLPGGVLDIQMEAATDAPTLCNLAHHGYFNLDGGRSVADHTLHIASTTYLPVDAELIPTGQVSLVENTRFDFRQPTAVKQAQPLDHNYCLSAARGPIRPVAWLHSAKSAVTMECQTTEPGLQIYDGTKIDIPLPGLSGTTMGAYAGLAMEPQIWPDANHHPHFPQAVLRPGESYEQHTKYIFSKENP